MTVFFFFFLCCLSSFPSSFHIFGCDPAEPSDSLLLNAAAPQCTAGSCDSSMLLPGINKSRRGASQTSPVLQADKISNLASQQCLMSPCCSLCCRHPSPHPSSLRLPSFETFQEFVICFSIFDQFLSQASEFSFSIFKYSIPYHDRYVESSCLAAWEWSRLAFFFSLVIVAGYLYCQFLKASSGEQSSASSDKPFQCCVIFPR